MKLSNLVMACVAAAVLAGCASKTLQLPFDATVDKAIPPDVTPKEAGPAETTPGDAIQADAIQVDAVPADVSQAEVSQTEDAN
jgi:hypothetical protein